MVLGRRGRGLVVRPHYNHHHEDPCIQFQQFVQNRLCHMLLLYTIGLIVHLLKEYQKKIKFGFLQKKKLKMLDISDVEDLKSIYNKGPT